AASASVAVKTGSHRRSRMGMAGSLRIVAERERTRASYHGAMDGAASATVAADGIEIEAARGGLGRHFTCHRWIQSGDP
ncbi:MAG: hypothetical protein ACT4SY_06030, partial [Hyphomicrobiales bacterium]